MLAVLTAIIKRMFCAEIFVAFLPVRAKAASRGIPLAAALQIRSPDSRKGQASACPDEQTSWGLGRSPTNLPTGVWGGYTSE
jgi:hypothetical protein